MQLFKKSRRKRCSLVWLRMKKIFQFFILLLVGWSVSVSASDIDQLTVRYNTAKDDTVRLGVMIDIINHYYGQNPDSALVYGYKAEKLAIQLEQDSTLAIAEREIARLLRKTGDYRGAIAYIKRAMAREEKLNNKINVSKALNILGVLYYEQSNFVEALKHYLKSLKLYEQLGNKDGIASIYNNLGLLYKEKGNNDLALKHYKKSLEINEQLKDSIGLAYGYNNLGVIYRTKGDYQTSLTYFYKSLFLKEALGSKEGIASSFMNIGTTYIKQGHFDKALNVVYKALEINKELNNPSKEAQNYLILAKTYLKLGIPYKSITYGIKAQELSKKIGRVSLELQANQIQYKAYKQMGNHEKALLKFELAQSMQDSLSQVQKTEDLANLKFNYDIEKQQLEIESLNKDKIIQEEKIKKQNMERNVLVVVLTFFAIIASILYKNNRRKQKNNVKLTDKHKEIASKNNELARLNQEIVDQNVSINVQKNNLEELNHIKNNLFTIVSHDFRSPLKSIQGFLNLLSMDALSKEEMKKLVDDLKDKVDITTEFLENLLTWARNQMHNIESKPQPINLRQIAEDNIALLRPAAEKKGVKLDVQIQHNLEAFADPNMINLVVRNLVVNAIKFSSANDMVTLTAKNRGAKGIFSVEDTGVGMDEKITAKIFDLETYSTTGTANEKGTGLGLILCKDFVEKNNGTIWAESKLGKGSIFSFTLPLTPKPTHVPVGSN